VTQCDCRRKKFCFSPADGATFLAEVQIVEWQNVKIQIERRQNIDITYFPNLILLGYHLTPEVGIISLRGAVRRGHMNSTFSVFFDNFTFDIQKNT
jgi:hypothetical protein